jgi:hypothetical protein
MSNLQINKSLQQWRDPNMKTLTQNDVNEFYNQIMKVSLRKHKIKKILKLI